jgi:hypothetical protein
MVSINMTDENQLEDEKTNILEGKRRGALLATVKGCRTQPVKRNCARSTSLKPSMASSLDFLLLNCCKGIYSLLQGTGPAAQDQGIWVMKIPNTGAIYQIQ